MSERGRDNNDARSGARRQRGGASGAMPQRRSERVLSQSPRGRRRISPPPLPPPRQSEARGGEDVALLASPFDLPSPRVLLLAATTVLATVAQALCLLPVAWPRGSPVLELCGGAAGARVHAAVALALTHAWLLQRDLPQRPVRAACMMLAHLALGSLAAGVYVLWALRDARGDWARFWMGGDGMPRAVAVQGRGLSPPMSPRPRGRPRKHVD